ncbi:MAG: hypothetical protein IIX87_04470, partial [Firmicutes bacterium]|nr:hypothetical protein [Bacillota bacterium]
MRNLIDSAVCWEQISAVSDKSEYRYELGKGVINKESGVLTLPLTLNFIVPFLDCEKIKALVINKLDMIKDVKFEFDYRDVVLSPEEIVGLYIPHMIHQLNGNFMALTKSIDEKDFHLTETSLTIRSLGNFATDQLNQKVAAEFQRLLAGTFGIRVSVKFENNEELYREKEKHFIESEAKDIESSLKEQAADLKAKAEAHGKSQGAAPAAAGGGSGWQPQGGGAGPAGAGASGKGQWKRREKELPAEGNRIMGRDINAEANTALMDIDPSLGTVIVEGILFKKESRVIKSGNHLVTMLITDERTTICCKCFASEAKWGEIDSMLSPGTGVKIRGEVQFDTFENMNTIMMKDIEKTDKKIGDSRVDMCETGKRVELHCHTKMSSMDGLNEVSDIV